jgi:hypothetical protein
MRRDARTPQFDNGSALTAIPVSRPGAWSPYIAISLIAIELDRSNG